MRHISIFIGIPLLQIAICFNEKNNSERVAGNDDQNGSNFAEVTQLPDWCFDPPGTDCTWYRECLSKLDNCTEKATSYAIGFGETICTEFRTRRGEFSLVGQKWINSTTACLQKKLVTALTPKEPMTCEEVQTFAFHTHSSCYTDTPLGAPSFCDLDFADWLRVSWIVKQALVRETSQTVQQAAQILGHCASHLLG